MSEETDDSKISTIPPIKQPKGGEIIYVFWDRGDSKNRDDWRCDQCRWVCCGAHQLPKKILNTEKHISKSTLKKNRVALNLLLSIHIHSQVILNWC